MLIRLATSAFVLCFLVSAVPATAGTPTRSGPSDHPVKGPAVRDPAALPPQLPVAGRPAPRTRPDQPGQLSGFLTLPFLGPHYVTSVFDHCNPTYVTDGRVCRFDGVTAVASNGVDPTFPRGYAITKGGSDYLYYDGHNGWDYALTYEPVMAAAEGVVSSAGLSDPPCVSCGFGLSVVVDHPNGVSTRYGHLSRIDVQVGQPVGRGQGLGVSGNTGASTGPHLHFGAYITSSWTAVDPYGWEGAPGADPWPFDQGDLWLSGVPVYPVPGAPSGVFATSANGSASVRWSPPAWNGGGITGYTITSSPGGAKASVPGTATTGVVSGLSNGTAYTFTVRASSAFGDGDPSPPSNSVTPMTIPGAPLNVDVTGSNGSAVVSWVPPDSGGGAITGYTVSGPGGIQVGAPGGATAVTVPNLGNGTSYSFAVNATNAAGSSAPTPAGTATPSAPTYYFAEGYTGDGFNETLQLLMPDNAGTATVDFFTESGHSTSRVALVAGKVAVVDVKAVLGSYHQVSARVTFPYGGVAERLLRFSNPLWNGSTDSVGVGAPGQDWHFAEGSTLPSFSEYLTLQNPNSSPATVDLNYFFNTGEHPVKTTVLPAASRTTVEVFSGDTSSNPSCSAGSAGNCGIGRGAEGVSVSVHSRTLPIVAERPMYVNGQSFGSGPIRDGHVAFGAASAQTSWSFSEGTTLQGFNEYLTLENPGSSAAAVTLTYYDTTSKVTTRTLSLPPQRRSTVEVFSGSGAGGACASPQSCGVGTGVGGVSVRVSSDQPVVAERPLYLVHDFGSGPVAGATVVVGATNLAQWFSFASGSTRPGDNPYLTIWNPQGAPASVSISYFTPAGAVGRTLSVPAFARHTVEVFGSSEGPGAGHAQVGAVVSSDQPILVEKPTYSTSAASFGATDTLGAAGDTFFFSEGYTGSGFRETISLLAPNVSGTALLDYYTESGHVGGTATVLAGHATNVDVNAAVGPDHAVSVRVVLPGPGVAERIVHFEDSNWHGSFDKTGVVAPRLDWNFAEGSTLAAFNEYLSLFNPGVGTATVDLTYFTDGGKHPVKTLEIAPGRRQTVEVFTGDLGDNPACSAGANGNCGVGRNLQGVAVHVHSRDQLVVAERSLYVNRADFGAGPIRDGHDSFGAAAPAQRWYFAEGTTLPGFNEFLSLQNANSAEAHVTLDYYTEDGVHSAKTLTMAGQSRATVEVFGSSLGVGGGVSGVSVQVSSDQAVIAERPMYIVHDFGRGQVAGASDVVGATSLATLFGFSGLSTQPGDSPYLTIENPGSQPAQVDITYFMQDGPVQRGLSVPAGARRTVDVGGSALGIGQGGWRMGAVLRSNQPVMVEKPAYGANAWSYGASDTLGVMAAGF